MLLNLMISLIGAKAEDNGSRYGFQGFVKCISNLLYMAQVERNDCTIVRNLGLKKGRRGEGLGVGASKSGVSCYDARPFLV